MSDVAIKVEKLSKRYRIGQKEEIHDTFYGAVSSLIKSPFKQFNKLRKLSNFDRKEDEEDIIWALRDVSFEVNKGEVVGIIGKNGAGKSTLLKVLSRIVDPTFGKVHLNGKVSSLLEVGTGFNPELTGRENIYLNGTILGMKKIEIDKKFDEIVDFSEMEKFLDTPVKRYSSGMTVRLAFAVAAHLEPQILLVDEVLAVGDLEFQKKCIGRINNVAKEGRTILFVSHNMHTIRNLCETVIYFDSGKIKLYGDTDTIINEYMINSNMQTSEGEKYLSNSINYDGNHKKSLKINAVRTLDISGKICSKFNIGEAIIFEAEIENNSKNGFVLSFSVQNDKGILVYHVRSQDSKIITKGSDELATIRLTIEQLKVVEGRYTLNVWLGNHLDQLEEFAESILSFYVIDPFRSTSRLLSVIHEIGDWEIIPQR